jgi:hypothetical protein
VAPAAAASFAPYLVFFFDPPIWLAIPLLVVSGVCGLYGLGLDGRVRDAAPLPLFARTMALSSAGLMALQGLGFMLAGAIAEIAGPSAAIGIAGACGTAAVLILARHELFPFWGGLKGVASGRRASTASIGLEPKEATATDL